MDIKSLTGNNHRTETANSAAKARVSAGLTASVVNNVSGEITKPDQSVRTPGTNFVETITATEQSPVAQASRGAMKGMNATGESVTLTSTALTMTAALNNAAEVPFDSNKVAKIKAAIAEGRYPIDNQRLAQRMLDFEDMFAR
ncbi:flagellar biosynthesis anti-sigma factor FlgM [Chromatium okenii]|uniref:flagellar biosynthesis anti-sigma factor FlgM n=1 Tax=Chromatium okenii TaxID=61644 RepID=UPI0026EBFF82|nr:flagellar biosynthesis anti-sigma factor FlgM [Chromatium okenii]MBV5308612.1 flagellar biosynthesis anti-sigma factor FlgM [Chromatium okenii]